MQNNGLSTTSAIQLTSKNGLIVYIFRLVYGFRTRYLPTTPFIQRNKKNMVYLKTFGAMFLQCSSMYAAHERHEVDTIHTFTYSFASKNSLVQTCMLINEMPLRTVICRCIFVNIYENYSDAIPFSFGTFTYIYMLKEL